MKTKRTVKRPAALFDLDNTITRIDTIIPFLFYYAMHRPAKIPAVIVFLFVACLSLVHIVSNERMKRVMSGIFAGEDAPALSELSAAFVREKVRALYRPEALAEIARLKKDHMLILVSASYEIYLEHIARDLGFDHAIGTVLWRHGRTITGKLYGKNCRGQEKVYRLRTDPVWHMIDTARSCAYGDSFSDAPMLSLVKKGFAVTPDRRLMRLARERGFTVVRWRDR